jgi:hypothetical protein
MFLIRITPIDVCSKYAVEQPQQLLNTNKITRVLEIDGTTVIKFKGGQMTVKESRDDLEKLVADAEASDNPNTVRANQRWPQSNK